MPAHSHSTKTSRFVSIFCAAGCTISGLLGLCGWVFNNEFLRTFLSDGAFIKVNTALLLIAGGGGLWLLNMGRNGTARLLFILMILVSLAVITEHLFKINLHIDELLLKDRFTNAATQAPGRTSLLTAFNLLLAGIALLLLSFKRYNTAELLACCMFIIVYIFLVGHLFYTGGFYQLGEYSAVVFHTASGLAFLAVGILLFDVQRGWIALVYPRFTKKRVIIYLFTYFFFTTALYIGVNLFIIHSLALSHASEAIILLSLAAILTFPVIYFVLVRVNKMKNEILKAEHRIEVALSVSNLGSYDLDLDTNNMKCSDQCKKNFGLAATDTFNFPDLLQAIVPEHREMVMEKVKQAIENKSMYQAEYQARWPDGSLHWITASGRAQYGADGKPLSMSGVTYDNTERLNQIKDMERSFEQARLSKEAAELGTFDMNLLNGTMEWDERCRILFGIGHAGPVTYKKDFVTGLHPDDRDRVVAIISRLFEGENNGDYDVEYRTIGADDKKLRWVRAKGKVFYNNEKTPVRFIGSVFDITENKEDEQRKNDFIGMVSHELKTPLTSLLGYLEILLMKTGNDDDQFTVNALTQAKRQVKKMTALINGFLNLSRLESGKIAIYKSNFVINQLIREVINEAELTAPGNLIHVEPCDDLEITADRDKIGSVLSNLLSNAIKFSPKQTHVSFKCEKVDNMVQISVTDEGIGIKQQDLGKLFDRYYRVENENSKTIAGFGIGLYLSHEIIRRHHGKIWVISEIGKGSTFYFTIPIEVTAV